MTCVYDTLIKLLNDNKLIQNVTPIQFINILQHLNKKTRVLVNGIKLTNKQQKENIERINNITILNNKIIDDGDDGYLCSGCDPILLLVCDLYNVNIIHDIQNEQSQHNIIEYTCIPTKSRSQNPSIFLKVYSNLDHFHC